MDIDWARLGDEQAIRDVLARYWRGIDRRDPALVLGTYHPGAFDDHGYFQGPVEGFVETLAPGVWAHFAKTQHFAGNIQIDFRGEGRARVESYAVAHHVQLGAAETETGRDLVYGLRYVDDFERRADEWRVARRVCVWDWHRVDPVGGMALPPSYFRGHHSPADPVYAFPPAHGRRVGPDELIAKQACLDALMRYTRGVDRCEPELVRSAYQADAFDDHGGYQGDVEGFLAWVAPTVMKSFSCTMHKLGNTLIQVEGGRAWAETYAIAHHVTAEDPAGSAAGRDSAAPPGFETRSESARDLVMGIRYLDRLEDRGDGWKIADRKLSFEWERSVDVGSQREYPGFLRGRRDGNDPVLEASPGARAVAVPRAYAVTPADVADRAAILRQLVRYCRGVDRRDLALVRSTYHPDAFDDHGTYKGDIEGFLAFVAHEVHARFRTTVHKLGQSFVELDGDVARAESYAICHHVMAEPDPAASAGATRDVADMVMGIRYVDRFERRSGEWRIARRELRWEWLRTDRLEPLDPTWTAGCADAGDPVFAA